MKQTLGVKMEQKQTQTMSLRQIQSLDFMMLGQNDLDSMIRDVFETNPTIEIEDGFEGNRSLVFEDVLDAYVVHNSLKDDLYLQLMGNPSLDYERMSYLIESLDEYGFIPTSDTVLADELNIDVKTVGFYRNTLQHFEPTGIGSQGVKESITIQLEVYDDAISSLAIQILNEFLSKNNYDESLILKHYEISKETLDEVLNRIHGCTPRFQMEPKQNERAFPDAMIYVEQQEIICEMSRNYEKLRINYQYEKSDEDQVQQWYRESKQLLENIRFRNSTLLDVIYEIINHQKEFFLMQKPLNSLTLSDVADTLNLSVSTISRAISNKVVVFNQEIYLLSDFFIATTRGGDSADAVKRRIVNIVNNESKVHSDQKIVEILKGEGIKVERRTVAKYRKELNIPSSSERSRIKKWD